MRTPSLRSSTLVWALALVHLNAVPPAKAQNATHNVKLQLAAMDRSRVIKYEPELRNLLPETASQAVTWKVRPTPASPSDRQRFFLMSTAVYGLAFLDMHETVSLKPGLFEHDPLARPFTRLPNPAYYACGAAMATGVNWAAWRMLHSHRWRKIWWAPQLVSASGNLYGYASTRARD